MNHDFEKVYSEYVKMFKNSDFKLILSKDAEYFFNAGVASTKRKPEQIPALFKPKEQL